MINDRRITLSYPRMRVFYNNCTMWLFTAAARQPFCTCCCFLAVFSTDLNLLREKVKTLMTILFFVTMTKVLGHSCIAQA